MCEIVIRDAQHRADAAHELGCLPHAGLHEDQRVPAVECSVLFRAIVSTSSTAHQRRRASNGAEFMRVLRAGARSPKNTLPVSHGTPATAINLGDIVAIGRRWPDRRVPRHTSALAEAWARWATRSDRCPASIVSGTVWITRACDRRDVILTRRQAETRLTPNGFPAELRRLPIFDRAAREVVGEACDVPVLRSAAALLRPRLLNGHSFEGK